MTTFSSNLTENFKKQGKLQNFARKNMCGCEKTEKLLKEDEQDDPNNLFGKAVTAIIHRFHRLQQLFLKL